jgi:hypothetical protein
VQGSCRTNPRPLLFVAAPWPPCVRGEVSLCPFPTALTRQELRRRAAARPPPSSAATVCLASSPVWALRCEPWCFPPSARLGSVELALFASPLQLCVFAPTGTRGNRQPAASLPGLTSAAAPRRRHSTGPLLVIGRCGLLPIASRRGCTRPCCASSLIALMPKNTPVRGVRRQAIDAVQCWSGCQAEEIEPPLCDRGSDRQRGVVGSDYC